MHQNHQCEKEGDEVAMTLKKSTLQHSHSALNTRLNPMQMSHTALLHAAAHPSAGMTFVSNWRGMIADANTAQPKQIMYKL